MFQIAFGFLLYHVLRWLLVALFVLFVVIPFGMNLFDGRGYGFNVKKIWGGLLWVLRLGFAKREAQ